TEYRRNFYQYIEEDEQAETRLSIERMCELGQVSRAGWYRRRTDPPEDRDLELRDEIQKIALEWPAYGSRRITAELRRRKWAVNRKRVRRLMREDNLLCLRKRKFVVTTDSDHGLRDRKSTRLNSSHRTISY